MSLKYCLFWMTLLLLDVTVYGGIPSLRRRRRDDAAKTEHSVVHSDDFLASFLSTVTDSEADSNIKKAAPTTVSNPVPVPRDTTNEIEARTDIVTGFTAIAGVVASAVGQFLSFLVRKKLVLAAVVAAIFASLGISKVITDDLIGVAENISGQRIERQFSESTDPAVMAVQRESFINQLLQLLNLASWIESADVSSNSLVSSGTDGDSVLPADEIISDLSTTTSNPADADSGFQLFDIFNVAAWFGSGTGDDTEAVTYEDVAQEPSVDEDPSPDNQIPSSQTADVRTIPSPVFIDLPLVASSLQDQDVSRSETIEETKVFDAVLQAVNSQIAATAGILSESPQPILQLSQAGLIPSSSVSPVGNQEVGRDLSNEGQFELGGDDPNKSVVVVASVKDLGAIEVDLVRDPDSATLSIQSSASASVHTSVLTDSPSLLKFDTISIPKYIPKEDIKSNSGNEAFLVSGLEVEGESIIKGDTVDTVSVVDQSKDESSRVGKAESTTDVTELVQETVELTKDTGGVMIVENLNDVLTPGFLMNRVAPEVDVLTSDQSSVERVGDNPPLFNSDNNLKESELVQEEIDFREDSVKDLPEVININELNSRAETSIENLPKLDNLPVRNPSLRFRSLEELPASVDTSATNIEAKLRLDFKSISDPVRSKLLSGVAREGKAIGEISEERVSLSTLIKDETATDGYKYLLSTLRSVEVEFEHNSQTIEDLKDWKRAVFVNEEIADDQQSNRADDDVIYIPAIKDL